ncbi:MAG: hypothetical protein LRY54_03140 [Alphaproteobacteria bacterium]|nr:hypothetical protein [Alphaproteobacteria bacterium]
MNQTTQKTLLFFFRGYNDIDHMTPVIDKLRRVRPDYALKIYIADFRNNYRDDYRVQYLQQSGIPVNHILSEMIGWEPLYWQLSRLPLMGEYVQKLIDRLGHKLLKSSSFCKNFLQKQGTGLKAVLYDHTPDHYASLTIEAKEMGIRTFALPHAVDNWANILTKNTDLDPALLNRTGKPFLADRVIVPNVQQKENFLTLKQITEEQVKVLGSPRFSDEWMDVIRRITPPSNLPQTNDFKIVFMLTKVGNNIFEEEVMRQIAFVSRMKGVKIALKLHTRNMKFSQKLSNDIILCGNEVHSQNLIDWADVTLFTATSVILDALKLDKPVLFLRRTVANKLVYEETIDSWAIDCRDDLYRRLEDLKSGKTKRTYTEKERQACLDNLVESAGKNVLDLYVDEIMNVIGEAR